MHLRLNLFPGPVVTHVLGVNLIVKVTDVANDGAFFYCVQHVLVTHINVTGSGDDKVSLAQ